MIVNSQMQSTIKIEIPSLTENIRIVESFIDNLKDKFQIDDDNYGNIMVAVTEAINNAIRHGNGGDKNKNVVLSATTEDNLLKFFIEDQGKGFDYNNLPDPTAPENLDKLSGRGIFLMKQLADEVHFHENGSKTELIFYFT